MSPRAGCGTGVLHIRLVSTATGIDFSADNLLITQGVQVTPTAGTGSFFLADGGAGVSARYNGVTLARDAKTVVRFFAHVASTGSLPAGTALRPSARLFGFVDRGAAGSPFGPDRGEARGAALPGSPLIPDLVPAELPATTNLSTDLTNQNVGYQFTLPASWTEAGTIILEAEVNPAATFDAIPEANQSNNGFQVDQIRFASPHDPIRIYAVALTYTGAPGGFGEYYTVPDPWFAYDHLRRLVPMHIDVPGYRTIVDISSIMNSGTDFNTQSGQILSLLGRYNDEGFSNQYVLGFTETNRQSSLPIQGLGQGFLWGHGVAYVAPSRPLTSVGHETFHLLGFSHAGGACPGVAGSGPIETWPAGDMGDILGTGLDINNVLGPAARGRYQPVADATGAPWFDFMSYCADPDEHNSWISSRYWNRLLGGPDINSASLEYGPTFPVNLGSSVELASASAGIESPVAMLVMPDEVAGTGPSLSMQSANGADSTPVRARMLKPIPSNEPTLQVFAWLNDQKGEIWRINSGKRLLTPSDSQSPYHFLVRDASGNLVSDTAIAPAEVHLHHSHSTRLFAAEIVAPRADRVQLVMRSGSCPSGARRTGSDCLLAERRRNPQAPTVKFTEPAANSSLEPGKPVAVSWAVSGLASGAQTFADLEYSADDGNTWRAIAGNLGGNSALLPDHLFPAAKAARLRITLNDGFNESAAISERFTAPGLPPSVHIVNPKAQFVAPWGAAVYFSGEGYDDAGSRLSPKQLEWFDGKTSMGFGEVLSNSKLDPGVHTIQLVARDEAGRTYATSETIEITPPSSGGDDTQQDKNQQTSSEQPPSRAPAGSTILVPDQVFAGGVLTGVVLGPDDQPLANAPVQISSGGIASNLSGEVVGDDPAQTNPGTKTDVADTGNKPNPLTACAESLKAFAAQQGQTRDQTTVAAGVGGSPIGKNTPFGQIANVVHTDSAGRFAMCVLPDAPKVAVSLPAQTVGGDGKPTSTPIEAKVIQDAADIPVPQPPFPKPPEFMQPDQKFSLPGIFPKGSFEQNGKQGNVPVATAISGDGKKSISTFKTPHSLQPGPVRWTFTDQSGKQASYNGGIFKILRASLDRSKLRSNEGADFEYEVLASPEAVPNGLCVDIKLAGPIVMVQAPSPQIPLDASGHGKFGGKIRATQVAPGSSTPFDINTSFHSCTAQ